MSLEKKIEFRIEGGMFIIEVDPNQDGQNVIEVKVDLAEVPDEVISALKGGGQD